MIAKIIISQDLVARKDNILQTLASHLESGNTVNHPDLLYFPSDSKLGVMESKQIRAHLSIKPSMAKGRAVVLEQGEVLTVDAQNALLKTLEELPENALFIIGASSESKFLPTILSRCEIIYVQNTQNPTSQANPTRFDSARRASEVGYEKQIKKLLESDIPERFEYVEKLKNKEEFLHDLIQYFHQTLRSHLTSGKLEFLRELLQAEQWSKQNVNIRAILEYLMLVMPQKL